MNAASAWRLPSARASDFAFSTATRASFLQQPSNQPQQPSRTQDRARRGELSCAQHRHSPHPVQPHGTTGSGHEGTHLYLRRRDSTSCWCASLRACSHVNMRHAQPQTSHPRTISMPSPQPQSATQAHHRATSSGIDATPLDCVTYRSPRCTLAGWRSRHGGSAPLTGLSPQSRACGHPDGHLGGSATHCLALIYFTQCWHAGLRPRLPIAPQLISVPLAPGEGGPLRVL